MEDNEHKIVVIMRYVDEHPGETRREIRDALKIESGMTQLNRLVRQGYLSMERNGKRNEYFPVPGFGSGQA